MRYNNFNFRAKRGLFIVENIDIIKRIYEKHQRPVMVLDNEKELIWCNMQANVINAAACYAEIRKNAGIISEFAIGNDIFFGKCELKFCSDIASGIYIVEIFVVEKTVEKSHSDKENERLNYIIREGVFMISSTLQLLYDELDSENSADSIAYLNNGMLGCYDMLRAVSLSVDYQKAVSSRNCNSVVDFSCLVDDIFGELEQFSDKLSIKFQKDIEPGIFVECDYDSLYNAVSHLIHNVCRKNIMNDITIVLQKSGNDALFSVEAGNKNGIADGKLLRKNREFDSEYRITQECIGNIINTLSGRFVSHNSFSVPMCNITSIPLKSPQMRYKADRFSKSRVLLSDIYKIDYFDLH